MLNVLHYYSLITVIVINAYMISSGRKLVEIKLTPVFGSRISILVLIKLIPNHEVSADHFTTIAPAWP